MERSSARVVRPQAESTPLDFKGRLKEIDRFFGGRGREYQAMHGSPAISIKPA